MRHLTAGVIKATVKQTPPHVGRKGEISMDCTEAYREHSVIELLFMPGIRISELCELHRDDIDLSKGTICVYGKGSKERMIPIGNNKVLQLLQEYEKEFEKAIKGNFFVNRYGEPLSTQSVRLMIQHYSAVARSRLHCDNTDLYKCCVREKEKNIGDISSEKSDEYIGS